MSMCEFPGAVTGKKICITNRQLLTGTTEYTAEVRERFLQRLSLIARHHLADGVILREKELSARQYEELAGAAYHICRAHDLPLILHHFAETAAGFTPVLPLHLSMPEFLALKAGDEKLQFPAIGVSTHTVQEALEAEALGASYITASHIFITACKEGLPPRGLDYLWEVCSAVSIPVFALGGIHPENICPCLAAGAAGMCMMSEYYGRQITVGQGG